MEGGRKSAFVRARARNSKKSSLIVLERSLEKIDLESWSKNRACSRIFLREYLFLIKKRRKISSLLNYPRNFQLINYSSNLNSMNLDGSLLPTINNIFIRPRIVSIVTLIETRTIVSAIAEGVVNNSPSKACKFWSMTINRLPIYGTTVLQRWYNWTTQSRYVSTDANLFYELQPLHTCVYHNRGRDPCTDRSLISYPSRSFNRIVAYIIHDKKRKIKKLLQNLFLFLHPCLFTIRSLFTRKKFKRTNPGAYRMDR